MAANKNNFPSGKLDEIEKPAVKQMVMNLRQLYDMGQPKTDAEVDQRVDSFFALCERTSLRPGIESLCLSLHITRQTLFRWAHGDGCSQYRQETIQCAKSFVSAYIEQAALSGYLNPATTIFLLKNWCSYRGAYSFETAPDNQHELRQKLTGEEILARIEEDIPVDDEAEE